MTTREPLLPPKEQTVFKTILKLVEGKAYKKSLKLCDGILKRFPTNGETLAMKALVLYNTGKKPEAMDMVKLGVRHDIRSHICWHVYGIILRSQRMYVEAIKAYMMALKLDKDNGQLLRELGQLQAQVRDAYSYVDTRTQILASRTNLQANWTGLAVAYHLQGEFESAIRVLEEYLNFSRETAEKDKFEYGETHMYVNSIIEETGNVQRALDHLVSIESKIVDRRGWREKKAEYLVKLGRLSDAEADYRILIDVNPDDYSYHSGLQRALGVDLEGPISDEQRSRLQAVYVELAAKYPKAEPPRKVPIFFLTGDALHKHLDDFLRKNLRKGVSSLFNTLVALFRFEDKVVAIDRCVSGYLTHLEASGKFAPDAEAEAPSTIMWTQLFAAQFYAHWRRTPADVENALTLLDKAIRHTPTNIEVLCARGKILLEEGAVKESATKLDEARSMDLADRFLNHLTVTSMLRADRVADAEATHKLFTKNDNEMWSNVHSMQTMWYEQELGASYLRQKDLAHALKMCDWIQKHFVDFAEDQMDFHQYSVRRCTFREYYRMLKWADKLYGYDFYTTAARRAIKIYLGLHDKPQSNAVDEDADLAGLPEEERKKEQRKRQKARKQKAEEDAQKKNEKAITAKKSGKKEEDLDPHGEALLKEEPLSAATKYVVRLLQYDARSPESQALAAHVYARKKKFILALAAIKAGRTLNVDHPAVHEATVFTLNAIAAAAANPNETIATLIREEVASILGSHANAKAFNAAYIAASGTSLPRLAAGARSTLVLDAADKAAALALLARPLGTGVTHDVAMQVHADLVTLFEAPEAATAFARSVAAVYPRSEYFNPRPEASAAAST